MRGELRGEWLIPGNGEFMYKGLKAFLGLCGD
jgi:hypothetical protein